MRILHYVDENNLAWVEPWIQLLKELSKLGVENHVLCRDGGSLTERLKENSIPFFHSTPYFQWAPWLARDVGRVIDAVKPDIIHTRLSSAARLGGYWGNKKRIPVVSTVDKYPKAKYYRNAGLIIGCSSAVTSHMRSLGFHEGLLRTVLNPVLMDRYVRQAAVRESHRASLGVSADEFVIIGMGRLVDWKAWDDYLRAIALVPAALKCRFWLVGSGDEERKLVKLASDLDISDRVTFFPFMKDVRPWLWASDLFIQTSKKPEGFSLMLIEAMASGVVPIATNIGGTLDIIEDGVNGFMFSPRDYAGLARIMENVLDRNLIAAAAPKAVASASKVSISNIAQDTLSIYREVLHEN